MDGSFGRVAGRYIDFGDVGECCEEGLVGVEGRGAGGMRKDKR